MKPHRWKLLWRPSSCAAVVAQVRLRNLSCIFWLFLSDFELWTPLLHARISTGESILHHPLGAPPGSRTSHSDLLNLVLFLAEPVFGLWMPMYAYVRRNFGSQAFGKPVPSWPGQQPFHLQFLPSWFGGAGCFRPKPFAPKQTSLTLNYKSSPLDSGMPQLLVSFSIPMPFQT